MHFRHEPNARNFRASREIRAGARCSASVRLQACAPYAPSRVTIRYADSLRSPLTALPAGMLWTTNHFPKHFPKACSTLIRCHL
jgi:hypothetical protein